MAKQIIINKTNNETTPILINVTNTPGVYTITFALPEPIDIQINHDNLRKLRRKLEVIDHDLTF